SSPVCGLRPLREDFLRTRKCPKPTIFTSLACSKAFSIWSNTASTTAADWRLDSPWAATALMRSFLVSRATPLRRHGIGDSSQVRLASSGDDRKRGDGRHRRHRPVRNPASSETRIASVLPDDDALVPLGRQLGSPPLRLLGRRVAADPDDPERRRAGL